MTYYQNREVRLGFADGTLHWGRPKLPYGMTRIGRVVMMGPEAGVYLNGHVRLARLDHEADQREKRQNREKFDA